MSGEAIGHKAASEQAVESLSMASTTPRKNSLTIIGYCASLRLGREVRTRPHLPSPLTLSPSEGREAVGEGFLPQESGGGKDESTRREKHFGRAAKMR